MIYDPERNRLYAAMIDGAREIRRFEWNEAESEWKTLPAIDAAGDLSDMDIDRGGRRLILANREGIAQIPLDGGVQAAQALQALDSGGCGIHPSQLRVLDDDETLISVVSDVPECLHHPLIRLDLVRGRLLDPGLATYASGALISPTLNRRRAYVGPSSLSYTSPVFAFESISDFEDGVWFGGLVPPAPHTLESNNDEEHLLINNTELWDLRNTRSARIVPNRLTRLSPDGSKAYSYVHGSGSAGREIVVSAIDWANVTTTMPELGRLPVTADLGDSPLDDPGATPETSVAMELSPDGKLLFVAGPQAIQVIELP